MDWTKFGLWATLIASPLVVLFVASRAIWSLKTGEIRVGYDGAKRQSHPFKFWYLFLVSWFYVAISVMFGVIAATKLFG